jgi:hypothetical protein
MMSERWNEGHASAPGGGKLKRAKGEATFGQGLLLIGFWMLMAGLLINNKCSPERTDLSSSVAIDKTLVTMRY